MALETILVWPLIGAVAGLLAGVVLRGDGIGLVGNIVVGILGAAVGSWLAAIGGWLFGVPGIAATGSIGATAGAIFLLLVVRPVKRSSRSMA